MDMFWVVYFTNERSIVMKFVLMLCLFYYLVWKRWLKRYSILLSDWNSRPHFYKEALYNVLKCLRYKVISILNESLSQKYIEFKSKNKVCNYDKVKWSELKNKKERTFPEHLTFQLASLEVKLVESLIQLSVHVVSSKFLQ